MLAFNNKWNYCSQMENDVQKTTREHFQKYTKYLVPFAFAAAGVVVAIQGGTHFGNEIIDNMAMLEAQAITQEPAHTLHETRDDIDTNIIGFAAVELTGGILLGTAFAKLKERS